MTTEHSEPMAHETLPAPLINVDRVNQNPESPTTAQPKGDSTTDSSDLAEVICSCQYIEILLGLVIWAIVLSTLSLIGVGGMLCSLYTLKSDLKKLSCRIQEHVDKHCRDVNVYESLDRCENQEPSVIIEIESNNEKEQTEPMATKMEMKVKPMNGLRGFRNRAFLEDSTANLNGIEKDEAVIEAAPTYYTASDGSKSKTRCSRFSRVSAPGDNECREPKDLNSLTYEAKIESITTTHEQRRKKHAVRGKKKIVLRSKLEHPN